MEKDSLDLENFQEILYKYSPDLKATSKEDIEKWFTILKGNSLLDKKSIQKLKEDAWKELSLPSSVQNALRQWVSSTQDNTFIKQYGFEKVYTLVNYWSSYWSKPTTQPLYSKKGECCLCSIGLETEEDGPTLDCKHKFCKECFDILTKDDTSITKFIECPLCKEKTELGIDLNEKLSFIENPTEKEGQYINNSFLEVPLNLEQQPATKPEEKSLKQSQDDGFILIEKPVFTTPTKYIPFGISPNDCQLRLKNKISNLWFAPCDLNEFFKLEEFYPIYIPFYYFSVTTKTSYETKIPEKKRENDQEMEWKSLQGNISNDYHEIPASGTFAVKENYVPLLENLVKEKTSFSKIPKEITSNALDFNLSGQIQERILRAEINFVDAFKSIRNEAVFKLEEEKCISEIKQQYGSTYSDLHVQTKFFDFNYTLVLLPIFFGAYKYHDQTFEVVASGNEDSIQWNRPYGTGWVGKKFRDVYKVAQSIAEDQNLI